MDASGSRRGVETVPALRARLCWLSGARKELAIDDAKVHDPSIIKLLKERVAKGVTVRVIGDIKGKDAGIEERRPSLRLHVRAIVRDGTRAFVGSQSLRKDELENRREVGLIIHNPAVARKILQVFDADWADIGEAGGTSKEKAAHEKNAASGVSDRVVTRAVPSERPQWLR